MTDPSRMYPPEDVRRRAWETLLARIVELAPQADADTLSALANAYRNLT